MDWGEFPYFNFQALFWVIFQCHLKDSSAFSLIGTEVIKLDYVLKYQEENMNPSPLDLVWEELPLSHRCIQS